MPSTFDELRSQLTQLSTDERAKLAYFLLDTLDSEEDASGQEIDEESRTEIARRVEEIRSGKAEGIPADELMARLHEEYP